MSKKKLRDSIDALPEQVQKPEKKKDKIQELVDEIKKKYGIDVEPVKNPKYRLQKIISYLTERYEFRYNLFIKHVEYRKKNPPGKKQVEWTTIEEWDENNLITEIQLEAGIKVAENTFRQTVASRYVSTEYEPILDYLYSLPKWDGKDRFNEFLQRVQLTTEKDRPLLQKLFKKWFVTMVASLIDIKIKNETILIFTGKEGRKKTRFFESLIPDELKLQYSYQGSFDFRDKDFREMLGTKILMINDELAVFSRTEQEILKATMSLPYIVVRRAYGRRSLQLWRKASFCGTTNQLEFLTDQGANRRYLPFAVDNVDLSYEFDIRLLYSQALEEFKNGINLWYSIDEIQALSNYNEKFRRKSQEEELIMKHYRIPDKADIEEGRVRYLTPTEIMHELASKDAYKKMNTNDTVLNRIGKTMHYLGFEKRNIWLPRYKQSRDVWCVLEVSNFVQDITSSTYVNNNDENMI